MRRTRAPEKPLSRSAEMLLEVTRRLGQIAIVARELHVTEGTIRHVLNGRWPPKEPTRIRMHQLWAIPLDGWNAPVSRAPPSSSPHPEGHRSSDAREERIVPTGVKGASSGPTTIGQGGRGAVLVEFDSEGAARSFRDKLQKAGARARLFDLAADALVPNPVPEQLTDEALTYLRGVVKEAPKGRQTQAGISAARSILDHVHAITPPPRKLGAEDDDNAPLPDIDDELAKDFAEMVPPS